MNELTNAQKENTKADVMAVDHVMNAHEFLLAFLRKFDHAKRGGIHDFMEISMFNMLNAAIARIDIYLIDGHKEVNANEIMMLVADAYQRVLDNIKRNLGNLQEVNFK